MKRLVALLVLVAAFPASADASAWKSGGTIFAIGQSSGALETTVAASGAALFAYPRAYPDGGMFVRSRPAGGPIAPRVALAGEHAMDPDLAGNVLGDAVVTWTERGDNSIPRRVVAALRRRGRAFDPPQTIVDGITLCGDATAAISRSGYAFVLFAAQSPGTPCVVYASVREPGSSHFGVPVQLSTTESRLQQVALDDRGNALVAWADAASRSVGVARYLVGGAGFQPSQSVGVAGEEFAAPAFGPLLLRVSAPTGAAIILYPSISGWGTRPAAAIGSTRAGFGRARILADAASFRSRGAVDAAAGADGTLAVVWRGGERQARRVEIARVGPGAESITSRDTNTISDLHAGEVAVAIADGGRVTVAWSRLSAHGKRRAVEAATCAPSEHCGKPQRLSFNGMQHGARPAAATSSTGAAFVTWVTPKAIQWAKAPGPGRFGRARRLADAAGLLRMHLYRGRRGAMLATLEQVGSFGELAKLVTYGER